ncbi:MAG: hypothetical protein ACT6S0_26470, partial [Roseateles sp.]|uniref:hypothetical protein n=1 Tax=Roseateles sp. TaxID=1971397 RepID=UPI004035623D
MSHSPRALVCPRPYCGRPLPQRFLLAAALLAIAVGAQAQAPARLAAPLSVHDAVRAAVDRAASPAAAAA